ncbi:unnamed protein product [Prunus armeniaca]
MPENNDGAKVCAKKHGDNCNDGLAGCINNEINNGAEGDGIDINMCMMGLQGCCVTRSRRRASVVFLRLYHYGSGNSSSVTFPKIVCMRRGRQCPTPSSSAASYSSFSRNIQHSYRHCPAPSSSAASYSFSSQNMRHSCRRCLASSSVLPSTSHLLGTSNIAAGTALHLPAVLPPTHPLLRTCDIAAGAALHLPACCLLLFRRLFSLAWGQLARCTAYIFLDTIGCTNLQHV